MGRVLLGGLPEDELEHYLGRVTLKAHTPKSITSKPKLRAEIRRVRAQGYAIVDEELELGLRSLAVPVATHTGRIVAAMNTGVHASRVSKQDLLKRLLPELNRGASQLGQTLGYR
jgi:IclR family pca regulon transcriptional regulator